MIMWEDKNGLSSLLKPLVDLRIKLAHQVLIQYERDGTYGPALELMESTERFIELLCYHLIPSKHSLTSKTGKTKKP